MELRWIGAGVDGEGERFESESESPPPCSVPSLFLHRVPASLPRHSPLGSGLKILQKFVSHVLGCSDSGDNGFTSIRYEVLYEHDLVLFIGLRPHWRWLQLSAQVYHSPSSIIWRSWTGFLDKTHVNVFNYGCYNLFDGFVKKQASRDSA